MHNNRSSAHNILKPVVWKRGSIGAMLEDEINKLTERENYDFNELKAEFFEPFN